MHWVGGTIPGIPRVLVTAVLVKTVVMAARVLALLWRGKGVVVSFQVAVRLGVELGLKGGELLRHSQEASHLHAQDHPDHICRGKAALTHHQEHTAMSETDYATDLDYFSQLKMPTNAHESFVSGLGNILVQQNPPLQKRKKKKTVGEVPHPHRIGLWLCTSSTGPGTSLEQQGSASVHSHPPSPGGLTNAPSPCSRDQTGPLQRTLDTPREARILLLKETQLTQLREVGESRVSITVQMSKVLFTVGITSLYWESVQLTCVLYSPGLCKWCIRGHRLSLSDCHIFHKGHARGIDVGALKVIVGSNCCL